ncbi:hypothetical protein SAMN05421878_102184 [Actinobaculum suis]|uniref:Uncharacterized protein n=1 Tax=Actinobaculum suis TaxID=1657 RepID=A0A1G7ADJ8_9ACTO|nr:hypothetical protein [Actinobaculum suis]MDY5152591.1 hypothetical protein [Actinobaculum suis]SDE13018.1 hypothetical protein SAMN05421878_102184 [Actinobaculum suis]
MSRQDYFRAGLRSVIASEPWPQGVEDVRRYLRVYRGARLAGEAFPGQELPDCEKQLMASGFCSRRIGGIFWGRAGIFVVPYRGASEDDISALGTTAVALLQDLQNLQESAFRSSWVEEWKTLFPAWHLPGFSEEMGINAFIEVARRLVFRGFAEDFTSWERELAEFLRGEDHDQE